MCLKLPVITACDWLCSSVEAGSLLKGGLLSAQHPQRHDGKELKILVQPETQHRARYLTEGSRGSVKDRTQQGFPTVKVSDCSDTDVKTTRTLLEELS